MMSFLGGIVGAILGTYLSLTQGVANFLTEILPSPEANQVVISEPEVQKVVNAGQVTDTSRSPSPLPSQYEYGGPIPQILKDNAAYQQAAVASALAEQPPTVSLGEVKDALVNIYCTYKTDEYIRKNTGTGFMIDPRGVVLTNAHVAQFLLLEAGSGRGETNCEIRAGSPASAKYKATILYISPAWIQKHANLIDDTSPKGTGERDYALLYVYSSLENNPLPAQFSYLSLNTTELNMRNKNDFIKVAGYPAQDLGGDKLIVLTPEVATTSIRELFTFATSTGDLLAIGGTEIGVNGSSGGPILNLDNEVIGLISTRGDDTVDGAGSLRALTASYINRTMFEETGFTLEENLRGDLMYRSTLFKNTLTPFLSRWLNSELED